MLLCSVPHWHGVSMFGQVFHTWFCSPSVSAEKLLYNDPVLVSVYWLKLLAYTKALMKFYGSHWALQLQIQPGNHYQVKDPSTMVVKCRKDFGYYCYLGLSFSLVFFLWIFWWIKKISLKRSRDLYLCFHMCQFAGCCLSLELLCFINN